MSDYVPSVNWLLMAATLAPPSDLEARIGWRAPMARGGDDHDAHHGLLYKAMRDVWKWRPPPRFGDSGVRRVDVSFFCANLLKIADGGWCR